MSRYTGPSWKITRCLACHLWYRVKNWQCRNYVPGQHGPNNQLKLSEYGLYQLKNKNFCFYGLGEKQFRTCSYKLIKLKNGFPTSCFFLERRLDNVALTVLTCDYCVVASPSIQPTTVILADGKRVDIPIPRNSRSRDLSSRKSQSSSYP